MGRSTSDAISDIVEEGGRCLAGAPVVLQATASRESCRGRSDKTSKGVADRRGGVWPWTSAERCYRRQIRETERHNRSGGNRRAMLEMGSRN